MTGGTDVRELIRGLDAMTIGQIIHDLFSHEAAAYVGASFGTIAVILLAIILWRLQKIYRRQGETKASYEEFIGELRKAGTQAGTDAEE